ncbi:MAG: radical SAM protein, partial [Fibrobacterota bacterium]
AEYIVEEIALVHKRYNIDAVLVEDDLFTGDRKRVVALVDLLGKQGLLGKISYYVAARAAQLDDEWVALLKTLGVVKVELGIESGSNRIAAYLKTGKSSMEINRDAISRLNRAGITVYAAFMAGAPPETMEDLKQTWKMIKWIRRNHVYNTCGISVATPLPGTGLWDDAVARGLMDPANMDWARLSSLSGTVNSPAGMVHINRHMTAEALLKEVARMNFRMRLGTMRSFMAFLPRRLGKLKARLTRKTAPAPLP